MTGILPDGGIASASIRYGRSGVNVWGTRFHSHAIPTARTKFECGAPVISRSHLSLARRRSDVTSLPGITRTREQRTAVPYGARPDDTLSSADCASGPNAVTTTRASPTTANVHDRMYA